MCGDTISLASAMFLHPILTRTFKIIVYLSTVEAILYVFVFTWRLFAILSYTWFSIYVLYALTTGNVCGEITGGLRVAIDG